MNSRSADIATCGLTGSLKRSAATAFTVVALIAFPLTASADCFDDAARYQTVNPWVLRAIAERESHFNPNAIHRNSNNTEDVGLAGINSVHLPELAKYGIGRQDLLDACKAAYVAAWRLGKMVAKYGNTWDAVGAYHSETPAHRDNYSALIKRIIDAWIAQGLIREQ